MKHILFILLAAAGIATSLPSCEKWEFLEEHPRKVDATTFMSNAAEVQSVINSIYYQLRRQVGFGRYLSVLSESLADYDTQDKFMELLLQERGYETALSLIHI